MVGILMPNKSKEVDAYIANAPDYARPILRKVRALFHAACPDIDEQLKWNAPSFEYKGIVGGMAAFKQFVSFGFWKQSLMKDPHKIFTKETGMGSGRITSIAELPPDRVLIAYIKEAVALNENSVKVPRAPRARVAARLAVPADLAKALNQNTKAAATFSGFSPSQQNEYVEWISGANQAATRRRRLQTAIGWMSQGKVRNWKYVRTR